MLTKEETEREGRKGKPPDKRGYDPMLQGSFTPYSSKRVHKIWGAIQYRKRRKRGEAHL